MTPKLLIVDDSELIRERLLALFRFTPGIAAIEIVATLAQAMQSVQREPPTLLILDLHLPDGLATQMIPALQRLCPGMQIAMFTDDASAFNRAKCLQAGVDWFFEKSTELENLRDVVERHAACHCTTTSTQGPLR